VMWGEKGDEFWCITFTVKFGTNNICEYLDWLQSWRKQGGGKFGR
jgi:hypothetical protein